MTEDSKSDRPNRCVRVALGAGNGIALGAGMGPASQYMGFWIAIGVAVGAGIGTALGTARSGPKKD